MTFHDMLGAAFPDAQPDEDNLTVIPPFAPDTARSCVAAVRPNDGPPVQLGSLGSLPEQPQIVQGMSIDEPSDSGDLISFDSSGSPPVPDNLRDMKLYLLLVGPYPGLYIAAKTGPHSMMQYLSHPTNGLVYSGLPGIPLHVRVASPEAAVAKLREYNATPLVCFPFFFRGP